MKKALAAVLLAVAIAATAQARMLSMVSAETPTERKVIKDPAEYNVYISALNTKDPAQKGAAFEQFVAQYPNSVVYTDALEQAMGAYQQAGNTAKVEALARTLRQAMPNNIRALAILVFIDRTKAASGDKTALQSMCAESSAGIEALPSWEMPEGTTEAEFRKLGDQMNGIFEGAAGFCALSNRDYAGARPHYLNAVRIDPNNLQDVYQTGISELMLKPIDPNGFWHCARAITIANQQKNVAAAQSINGYCQKVYSRYHGSADGWNEFAQRYGAQTDAPPSNTIAAAPSSCDIAVEAVKTHDPKEMSFSDWEFVLSQKGCSPAGTEAANNVWRTMQGLQKNGQAKLKLPAKVIAVGERTMDVAIGEDNQKSNTADVHVVMQAPLANAPQRGAIIQLIGVLTDYTPTPFMLTMEKGEISSGTN